MALILADTLSSSAQLLVVELDDALLRSDMATEAFWSACSSGRIVSFFRSLKPAGGQAPQQDVAEAARIDIATLPYDDQVIDFISNWRQAGGRTALIAGTDQTLAQAIADHLGLFDEAHSLDASLRGAAKARFLEDRFGRFAYLGQARADLPVWQVARVAITANASANVRSRLDRHAPAVAHLTRGKRAAGPIWRVMRPHQWLKNSLVFVPMAAAHQWDLATFLKACLAFFAFSFVASAVYVLNDLLDLAADRSHPRKKHRPFAAGDIPVRYGAWLSGVLLVIGMGLGLLISQRFAIVLIGYFVLTTFYSLDLKRRIVIDICVLAGLYTTRVFAGGLATSLPISEWLLAFSIFFFLSLAAVKRQAELVDSAGRKQLNTIGRGYHVNDLPIISMVAIGAGYVSVLVLALYVNSPAVQSLYAHPKALWFVCAVLLYWLTRNVLLAHRGQMHDDPLVFAVKDRVSQLCAVTMFGAIMAGMLQ